ncbi:ABC transporter ATP-binding protein [Prochlorococcus marinus]|uniref:ABC transporter ATP-binding protein n=1 Tax=Prochlorococcus marinus TaxID=1219 RepID=UPI00214CFFC4|nr:ABC transporter ATP-binding protein [Prochlorococcus marinus]
MENTELEIQNLWHKFKSNKDSNWVLKDINFSLNTGELVGLLGPSGCGKTTLLRLIAGFEKPNSGFIRKNGQIISDKNYLLLPERRKIGMVFQDYALFPHLNVWDNVCFGITKKKTSIERANWLLNLLGIYEFKGRYPHELSGGQSQRVALARALAPGTSLVLLDEPFCSLDVEVRAKLRLELSSVLKSCSASALLVTHDPQEALAICNRVAVMRKGEILQYSTPVEMVSRPSNDFVGQFALQRNILPIRHFNNSYSTRIGKLNISFDKSISTNSVCMFDKNSILIEPCPNGLFTVMAIEYRVNHYVYTVITDGIKLSVEMGLESKLNIGDNCKVRYILGKEFLVLPEKIKSNF